MLTGHFPKGEDAKEERNRADEGAKQRPGWLRYERSRTGAHGRVVADGERHPVGEVQAIGTESRRESHLRKPHESLKTFSLMVLLVAFCLM